MGELAALLESVSDGVDLTRMFRDGEPRAEVSRTSAYQAYVRQLPDGLDTSPEQRLPSRVYQVILAHRPLTAPPPELVSILDALPRTPTIPTVHARAIVSAVYDEHFESLDQWRAFVGSVSPGVTKLLATSFTVPKPSSPYFVQGLAATYGNHASGVGVEVIETEQWSATVRIRHPPRTLNDVSLVVWEEVLRAAMLGAGCRVVEIVIVERDEDSFLLKGQWR